jgi:hypothetical protein
MLPPERFISTTGNGTSGSPTPLRSDVSAIVVLPLPPVGAPTGMTRQIALVLPEQASMAVTSALKMRATPARSGPEQ